MFIYKIYINIKFTLTILPHYDLELLAGMYFLTYQEPECYSEYSSIEANLWK